MIDVEPTPFKERILAVLLPGLKFSFHFWGDAIAELLRSQLAGFRPQMSIQLLRSLETESASRARIRKGQVRSVEVFSGINGLLRWHINKVLGQDT